MRKIYTENSPWLPLNGYLVFKKIEFMILKQKDKI